MDNPVTANWKQVRLLVFDLDGTLVDSKLDLALSVNAMRAEMGLAPLPLELITSYIGHGATLLVRRALGDYATAENAEKGLAFFLAYYHDHMLDNTAPYPGVAEALEKLGGYKMAVLTNKPVNFSREMLTRLGFASHFAYIYGGNSFAQKKPDPVGLHKLMEDIRFQPARPSWSAILILTFSPGETPVCGPAALRTGSGHTRSKRYPQIY